MSMSTGAGHPFALWKACELHGVRSMQAGKFLALIRSIGLRVSDREYDAILQALGVERDGEVVVANFCKWVTEGKKAVAPRSNARREHPDRAHTCPGELGDGSGTGGTLIGENGSNARSGANSQRKVQLYGRVEADSGSLWSLPDIENDKYTLPLNKKQASAEEFAATLADLRASYELIKARMDRN
eukprot:TRINITY_DN7474_c0_g1_i1.p1 TRINITY_DN7474_c0_g1~~TRINITY_DN7474_c0_g1_i1.p1  ORF type:complete len:186 (+),score=29.66 TRINITY_DN7474_c0_g1_i1:47-604(+)